MQVTGNTVEEVMFLAMGESGHTYEVVKVLGREKIQKQLFNLGIVPGSVIYTVSITNDNFIITLKQTRLGIGRELVQKILVKQIDS